MTSFHNNRRRGPNSGPITNTIGVNDLMYEEYEFDKRLKKRQAKLICVTEEAFTHVRRVQHSDYVQQQLHQNDPRQQPAIMDPYETAQALFATIARDLRRYLRVTRQQPYFTRDSIVAHLAQCVSYDISPRAFLERYIGTNECLGANERALVASYVQSNRQFGGVDKQVKTDQNWILICESVLYQNVEDNLMLVLKQNEVSLMCTFKRMPRFSLIEDILDPKRNKFLIKMNSETTV
jgi:vang-like